MNALIVLNDPPYGSERPYNGLRLATSLAGAEAGVRVFLFGDAAACARRGQRVPSGYYNLATMLSGLAKRGVEVGVCGSCMDARGIGDEDLVPGARRSSMAELTDWVLAADRVVTF
jgi:uncharacterized protein involved in oxidation of intracellular sulfur